MKGKVVIVTGASSGIGRACSIAFSDAGASVVAAARREKKLTELKNNYLNGNCSVFQADVSQEKDCKALIEHTIHTFGKIDILINNAGISMRAAFKELDLDVIRKLIDTNFYGAVYCTKYALPHILKSRGSVVANSSITGFVALPGRTAYAASKFALNGFFEALRMENQDSQLHVMIVAPGFTESEIRYSALTKDGSKQNSSPRVEGNMMKASEVAKKIITGVRKRKRTVVLTNQGKLLILINKLFPKLADSLVYKNMSKETGSPV